MMKRTFALALLSIVTVPQSSHQSARAETATKTGVSQAGADLSPSQIFSRARSSVVVIVAAAQKDQRKALGSGFIVNHGRIVTNHHVVEGMTEAYVVFSDGEVKPVSRVIADSAQQDLIVLATETGNRSPLGFGDELSLQQGDSVYALGAPKGLELSFTNGIVSSFRKSNAQFLIQTTAPIAPGSSGGPLFDRSGHVVGVTTSMLSDAAGIYFSVGIGDVRRLLRTPQGVALPFAEWAKQQGDNRPSEPASGIAPRQPQEGQATTPSLQDTLSWMEKFSQINGLVVRNGKFVAKNALYHSLLPSSPWDCNVLITADYPTYDGTPRAEGNIADTASIQIIHLRDINPESIKADEYNNVEFETTDPSGKIDRIDTFDPFLTSAKLFSPEGWSQGNQGKIVEYFASLGMLSFDSGESAQRFATAFKHAVSLCGGAKAPF
jgi:S1-C subfamily serine protease